MSMTMFLAINMFIVIIVDLDVLEKLRRRTFELALCIFFKRQATIQHFGGGGFKYFWNFHPYLGK